MILSAAASTATESPGSNAAGQRVTDALENHRLMCSQAVLAWRSPPHGNTFRHDPGGAAAHVIVTVHDVEVFPLDSGPISWMPSVWDAPGAAEQRYTAPGSNCWSHVRVPVSSVELLLSLPKMFTMYWFTPGSPPGPLQAAAELQRPHWMLPAEGIAFEPPTYTCPGGPLYVIVMGKLPDAPGVPSQHCPFG